MRTAGDALITRISFVRHGEVYSHEKYFGRLAGGWLGNEGQLQVQTTALEMAGERISAVYASPILRTMQTAAAILERHREAGFERDDRLMEVFTAFDGQPVEVLKRMNYDVYSGMGKPYEQPGDVLERVLDFVRDVSRRHHGGHVVAVTHGDVIVFLLAWAMGLAVDGGTRDLLAAGGLADPYPAWASVTTVDFKVDSEGAELIGTSYRNPSSGRENIRLNHVEGLAVGR